VPYMAPFTWKFFVQVMGRDMGNFPGGRAWTRSQYALDNLTEAGATATNAALERDFRAGIDCWTRSPGVEECRPAATLSRADYRRRHVLKIEQHLVGPSEALIAPVDVDLRPTFIPGARTSATTNMVVFGAVQLNDDFELAASEIDALPRYYAGLVKHLKDARVANYQWNPTRN
jgi:hypothetical protein